MTATSAQIARPTSGRAAIAQAKRDARWVEMRNEGKTLAEIADHDGVAASTVMRGIRRVLRATITPAAEEMRRLHHERLETMILAFEDKMAEADPQAAQVILKALQAEAAMWGINAPVETNSNVTATVSGSGLRPEERDALLPLMAAEIERRRAQAVAAADEDASEADDDSPEAGDADA